MCTIGPRDELFGWLGQQAAVGSYPSIDFHEFSSP